MSAHLELVAAQAVHQARLFERAVHATGPWTMSWGKHRVKALRIVGDEGVTFYASFPAVVEWAEALPDTSILLECAGETVGVMALHEDDVPKMGRFNVSWTVKANATQVLQRVG